MLLGVDVGGTFTDAVLVDGERIHTAKLPTTPEDQSVAVIGAVEEVLRRAGAERRRGRGLRPRDDGRHQRAARGTRRPHRADRHPRLRRPARDRPPGPPRALPPLRAEAGAAGRAGAALRGGRADRARRRDRAAGRRRAAAARAALVRESGAESVAICLLFSYLDPAHERRDRRAPAPRAARRPRLRLARGPAPLPRVRALLDDGDRRLPLAPARPLPGPARRGGRGGAGCRGRS